MTCWWRIRRSQSTLRTHWVSDYDSGNERWNTIFFITLIVDYPNINFRYLGIQYKVVSFLHRRFLPWMELQKNFSQSGIKDLGGWIWFGSFACTWRSSICPLISSRRHRSNGKKSGLDSPWLAGQPRPLSLFIGWSMAQAHMDSGRWSHGCGPGQRFIVFKLLSPWWFLILSKDPQAKRLMEAW